MTTPRERANLRGENTPPIFVCCLKTPPTWPWRQRKIANLEATRSPPVPIGGLSFGLKRLRPWRPQEPAKYGVVYVRTDQIGGEFTARAVVDGIRFSVRFEAAAQARQRLQAMIGLTVAFTAATVLFILATMVALDLRAATADRLDSVERNLTRTLRQARIETDRRRLSVALEQIPDKGQPLARVVADLSDASKARQIGVEIEAFHWRPAGMGVEVRGEGEPFAKGAAQRADRPLRPGVWLWVPTRASATTQ